MTPEIAGKMKLTRERLRDEFAMAAMTGALASLKREPGDENRGDDVAFAAWCYRIADAMLAERAKEGL